MDVRTQVKTNSGDWLARFGESWKKQIEELQSKFGSAIEEVRMPGSHATDVPIVYVARAKLVELLKHCQVTPGFEYNFLADITATDEETTPRFEVIYNLYSTKHHYRFRVKTRVPEGETVPTAISVWPGANWAEREIWDMYGVKFEGHPDLRRILMDERWQGHPLRKDYPLKGYQIFTEPENIDPALLN